MAYPTLPDLGLHQWWTRADLQGGHRTRGLVGPSTSRPNTPSKGHLGHPFQSSRPGLCGRQGRSQRRRGSSRRTMAAVSSPCTLIHCGGCCCSVTGRRGIRDIALTLVLSGIRLGYSYRLCSLAEKLTEECFQKTPLAFVPPMRLSFSNGTQLAINGSYISTGTNPPGR